jgi:hypothetical protein
LWHYTGKGIVYGSSQIIWGCYSNTVKKFILGKRLPEYCKSERSVSILAPFARFIQDWLGSGQLPIKIAKNQNR